MHRSRRVKLNFMHSVRKASHCALFIFTHTIKKILFSTRAKFLRPRDRATLGSTALTLVRVDHSVRKVQIYTLVTKRTILLSMCVIFCQRIV